MQSRKFKKNCCVRNKNTDLISIKHIWYNVIFAKADELIFGYQKSEEITTVWKYIITFRRNRSSESDFA